MRLSLSLSRSARFLEGALAPDRHGRNGSLAVAIPGHAEAPVADTPSDFLVGVDLERRSLTHGNVHAAERPTRIRPKISLKLLHRPLRPPLVIASQDDAFHGAGRVFDTYQLLWRDVYRLLCGKRALILRVRIASSAEHGLLSGTRLACKRGLKVVEMGGDFGADQDQSLWRHVSFAHCIGKRWIRTIWRYMNSNIW
jgi:hypothetical protein